MKYKYVAIGLGVMMTMSMLTGCSISGSSSAATTDGTVYGEVTEIDGDTITINVGTQKEMTKPDSDDSSTTESTDTDSSSKDSENSSGADSNDAKEQPSGEAPSMLELTGETQEITVSDDTEYTKQSMGGPGEDGQAPGQGGDGQVPEKPDGDNNTDDSKTPGDSANTEKKSESSTDGKSSSDSTDSSSSDSSDKKGENSDVGGSAPKQQTEEISLDDISEGDTISITFADDGIAEEITVLSSGGGMDQQSGVDSYDAAKQYTTDSTASDETFSSTEKDENAILVSDGANVTLNKVTVDRKSSESTGGDNSSFYGVGAAVLTTEGKTVLKDSVISTDAAGGAGVFSYDKGTTYVSDSTITTKQDTSGGIHVAGGGKLYAWNLDVTTKGQSSAAIRSDRGGGTIVADGGTYTSNGTGSPAIYSTADIAVNDADLMATSSEAICIEGSNSIHLFDSNLTGNMKDDDQNDCTWNVILYQSMSGDSEEGNSTFEMNGGSLTAKNGGMFYTTNTESTITLSNVDIKNASDSEFFLQCTGNNNQRGWGESGKNGANCLFTAINQKMEGDVIWDSISDLDFYMTDNSTLTGKFVNDETYAGDGGDGYCNLYIEKGSTWTVTGDSTLSELQNAGTIVDSDGKTVTIKGTDGTVYVKGDSEYTITVGSYKDSADTSGASKTSNWSDYEVKQES